ncbi:hypothetical protein [Pectobacterium brasiliense]|nr:hypothetical protein [Pectobacterium brasiliense]MBN3262101.1 hypothetical protein [Pectobacterium brasiliense]
MTLTRYILPVLAVAFSSCFLSLGYAAELADKAVTVNSSDEPYLGKYV